MRILTGYIFIVLCLSGLSVTQSQQTYVIEDTLEAAKYFEKAKSFESSAVYDSSIHYYGLARQVYQNISKHIDDTTIWKGIVFCSNKIGWNLMLQDKQQESLTVLENNLPFANQHLGENDQETAQCYNNLATTYWRLGYYDKALTAYEKAFTIIKSLYGEESIKTANVLLNIGNVYADKGFYEKSIDIQLKALSIQLKQLGEENLNVASGYNNIGLTYNQLGDYDKALEYLRQGLSLRIKLLKPDHPLLSSSYNNLGNIFLKIKKYDEAIEMHKKALEIRIINFGEQNPQVAASYNNIGNSLYRKEDYDSAMAMYQKSLSIRNSVLKENHPDFGFSYMNIASVYSVRKDYENSLKYHNMALSLRINTFGDKHPVTAGDYLNIAEVYFQKREYDSSLYFCQKSIIALAADFNDTTRFSNPELKKISSPEKLFEALSFKAELFYLLSKQNDIDLLKASLDTYSLTTELVDKIRTGYKAEGSQLFLSERAGFLFEKAIKAALTVFQLTNRNEFKEKAFYFMEKSKSAVLQKALNESKAKMFSNIPADRLEKEKEIKSALAFYETELFNEQSKKTGIDSIKIDDYKQKHFSLTYQYEELTKELEKNYPSYYDLKHRVTAKSISEIQSFLDSSSTILEYFVGDSIICITTVTADSYHIVELIKPGNFNSLIKEFYTSIIKSETNKYITAANKLTELLITPVYTKIKNREKLIIIPHDVLFRIPFEALFTKVQKTNSKDFSKLNYLIKDFNVSYHYSAMLFVNSLEAKNKIEPEKLHSKNFVGFAPVFPKNNSLGYTISNVNKLNLAVNNENILRSVSVDGKNYDELRYSEWEVNSIIDLFNKFDSGNTSTAYFYADASEENFKTSVNDYKIIHIASHSFMNEDEPGISGVVFTQPTDSSYIEDGTLYSGETYNLNLNADLVVLSSCESGLGKLFLGEGMMALTRGFLYSGASNIIFSLWKIPDKHTSELMVEFYRQMINGKSYSVSLRDAKLRLIKNQVTARPRSWAGFVLIGGDN